MRIPGKGAHATVILIVTVTALGLALSYGLYGSPYARIGREHGYDPATYSVVRTIQEHVSKGNPPTPLEIITLRRLAKDENTQVRCRALSPLYATRGTAQMPAAAEIARASLQDPEWVVRLYALGALAQMGAPDAREVARRMLADPNENVRNQANELLRTGK